jgi:hypothetical protein
MTPYALLHKIENCSEAMYDHQVRLRKVYPNGKHRNFYRQKQTFKQQVSYEYLG